ncbi:hypothetical protein evm_006330 [Chilo suppressalis]|nr:hypothetical protein evm_006330 [Chilo suppressalis]
MAFSRTVFLTLVLSVVCSIAVQVPVFSWGDLSQGSIKSNPLIVVSADEYNSILKQDLKDDPFTVIFIEETLSVEDFSRKNDDGETSFPYLHSNIGEALYLPSVENPLQVLNKLADPEKVNHVKLTENGLSADIEPESGKFLFINLKDAREGESRVDLLRRHNDFMEDMFSKLQERYNTVVAIYTAHYPSWTVPESHSRVRRQANVSQPHTNDHIFDGLRIYAERIVYSDSKNVTDLGNIVAGSSEVNTTYVYTTLEFSGAPVKLVLNFRNEAGYWFFDTVTVLNGSSTEDLMGTTEIYALDGFSYRCGESITFTGYNETSKYTNVTFIDLKVNIP